MGFNHTNCGNGGHLYVSAWSGRWVVSRPALLITTDSFHQLSTGWLKKAIRWIYWGDQQPCAGDLSTYIIIDQATNPPESIVRSTYTHTVHSKMTVTKESFGIASNWYSTKSSWGDVTPNRAYSSTRPLFAESRECSPLHIR